MQSQLHNMLTTLGEALALSPILFAFSSCMAGEVSTLFSCGAVAAGSTGISNTHFSFESIKLSGFTSFHYKQNKTMHMLSTIILILQST